MIQEKFGEWTVISEENIDKPGRHYLCKCSCGAECIIPATTLRAKRSTCCKRCGHDKKRLTNEMVGEIFWKWKVLEFVGMKNRCSQFRCKCECGNESIIYGSDLKGGKTRQCTDCHNRKNAEKNITHGLWDSPEYKVWRAMIDRCEKPNSKPYRWYGARGIKVCDRWKSFSNFIEDMGRRPAKMTIDRIDNDGNYEPSNCRWISHLENCRNRKKR